MRGFVIRVFACLSLLFFLVPVTYVRGPPPPKNDSQYVNLEPIQFDSKDAKRKTVGRLEFLAGWKMSSENSDFGGFSAMLAMPDNRFFLLSDAGVLTGFTLNEKENLAERPFVAPLPDGPEKENEFAQKIWDAESIVHDPETGQFWVGYERYHGVWRYGPSFARKEAARKITEMQKWPENGGAEAMLKLEDGRFLVFSESAYAKSGGYQAFIFDGDPAEDETKNTAFSHQPPKGFSITDAALLPDGKALLLHRRFTPLDGVSAILSIANLSDIKAGEIWRSKRIAYLRPPIRVDNMEALAVTEEAGETVIWIASDDNFSALQESLFMKFRLLKGKKKRDSQKDEPNRNAAKNEKAGNEPGFSSLQD